MTRLPWTETGRDKLLAKLDDLDLKLYEFSGGEKYGYYYHFGLALRNHINRLFPGHEREMLVSPAMLFERCAEVFDKLDYRQLRELGYVTNIRRSFFQDAVARYLKEGKNGKQS